MASLNQSVVNFLDTASGRLGELISQELSWRARADQDPDADLQWWSCALTVDPACRFFAGASSGAWEELRHDGDSGFAVLVEAIERAAAERFGSEVRCTAIESCEAPEDGGDASIWETSGGPIEVVMSPEVAEALGGGSPEPSAVAIPESLGGSPLGSSMDMLLHVEIPVSVSLGRTRLRMKDLLGLGQGSVVELDQELGDQVEIRVNNCVIAHGEVVAVDGNYGVRIVSMVSNGKARGGLIPKEAA